MCFQKQSKGQNIRKQIDCKIPSITKQKNRVQNIRTETGKKKYDQVRLVPGTCSFSFYLFVLS